MQATCVHYDSKHLQVVQSWSLPSVAAVETNTATTSSAPSPQQAASSLRYAMCIARHHLASRHHVSAYKQNTGHNFNYMYYGSNHLELVQSPSVAAVETNTATSSSAPSPQLAVRIGRGVRAGAKVFARVIDGGRQEPSRAYSAPGGVPAVAAAAADVPRGSGHLPSGVWLRVSPPHHVRMGATCQPRNRLLDLSR